MVHGIAWVRPRQVVGRGYIVRERGRIHFDSEGRRRAWEITADPPPSLRLVHACVHVCMRVFVPCHNLL